MENIQFIVSGRGDNNFAEELLYRNEDIGDYIIYVGDAEDDLHFGESCLSFEVALICSRTWDYKFIQIVNKKDGKILWKNVN